MAFDQHYEEFTLDNGLKVALHMRQSATLSVRLRVHMGALSEGEGEQGLAFPVNIMPEDLEPYLDFVSDLAINPRLDKTRIDEERSIILREISEIKSARIQGRAGIQPRPSRERPSHILRRGK